MRHLHAYVRYVQSQSYCAVGKANLIVLCLRLGEKARGICALLNSSENKQLTKSTLLDMISEVDGSKVTMKEF